MEIINLRHSKEIILERKVVGEILDLKNPLQDIFQNSDDVKDIIMEQNSYNIYGCRAIAIYRLINHELLKYGIITDNITVKEFDDMADFGGELKDAWKDGTAENPLYDILDVEKLLEIVNYNFNSNLKYKIIEKKNYTENNCKKLLNFIKGDVGLSIKMSNIVYPNMFHFINIISAIQDIHSEEVYFKMKETYENYNGYNDYYVKWDVPKYYEIIY